MNIVSVLVRIFGIIIGLMILLLNLLTPLASIPFFALGMGVLYFSIKDLNFKSMYFPQFNYVISFLMILIGIYMIFLAISTPLNLLIIGGCGLLIFTAGFLNIYKFDRRS